MYRSETLRGGRAVFPSYSIYPRSAMGLKEMLMADLKTDVSKFGVQFKYETGLGSSALPMMEQGTLSSERTPLSRRLENGMVGA